MIQINRMLYVLYVGQVKWYCTTVSDLPMRGLRVREITC